MNSKKLKVVICSVISCCLVALVIIWFYEPEMKHIEDKNGANNYTVETLTDKNILKLTGGTIYEMDNENSLNDNKLDFKIFSGVMQIYERDYKNQDLQIRLNDLQIEEGNLRVVLLLQEEIVHEFDVNKTSQIFNLENVSGLLAIRIAGESADFQMEYYVTEN